MLNDSNSVSSIRDLILQIKEGLMILFIHISNDTVCLRHVTKIKVLSEFFEIVGIIITPEYLHFDQRVFVAARRIEVSKKCRDVS